MGKGGDRALFFRDQLSAAVARVICLCAIGAVLKWGAAWTAGQSKCFLKSKKLIIPLGFLLLSGCTSIGGPYSGAESYCDIWDCPRTAQQKYCKAAWQDAHFDPIRDKIELVPGNNEAPNSTSPTFISAQEKAVFKDFIGLHGQCAPAFGVFGDSPSKQWPYFNALYQGKIPWSVFTDFRYQVIRDVATPIIQEAEARWRESTKKPKPPVKVETRCNSSYGGINCTTTIPNH